ncbi:MAG: hypothetical protein ACOC5H_03060 [Desulfovermiculus sp.]
MQLMLWPISLALVFKGKGAAFSLFTKYPARNGLLSACKIPTKQHNVFSYHFGMIPKKHKEGLFDDQHGSPGIEFLHLPGRAADERAYSFPLVSSGGNLERAYLLG